MKTMTAALFYESVKKTAACWLWMRGRNGSGYGSVWINGRGFRAHRIAYELTNGPIPQGAHLDHLCRVRHCVNPSHLEAVTQQENILRGTGLAAQNAKKTHCPKGHPLSGDNLYLYDGRRYCRLCHKRHSNAYSKRTRSAK